MQTIFKMLLVFLPLVTTAVSARDAPRVAIIIANGGPDVERQGGFDMGELAEAHATFTHNGFVVDIASPSGGATHASAYDRSTSALDEDVMARLADSLPVGGLDPSRYDALFLVGGSAAMFDFPFHEALGDFVAAAYERGMVVGGVCHGPAALVNVRLSTGKHLVAGRTISAFTEEEETAFGSKAVPHYPFVLERALRERGAKIAKAPMMLVQVSADGRLVTGQNPFSTGRVVDEIVRATGRVPLKRAPSVGESTMELVAALLREEFSPAVRDISHDGRMLAAYGARLFELARSDSDVRRAMHLLEYANRSLSHPRVRLTLARAHVRLGELAAARAILKTAAAEFPDVAAIADLLAEVERRSTDDDPETSRAAD